MLNADTYPPPMSIFRRPTAKTQIDRDCLFRKGEKPKTHPARTHWSRTGSPYRRACARPREEDIHLSITTTSKAVTQAGTLAQLQALILGLQKQLPGGQFTLLSTVYTTATLVTALQGTLTALTAVTAAHAALKVTLAAWNTEEAKMAPVILALRRILQSMYADAPDTLAVFGLEARKVPAPRTLAQKAATAAKAKATRIARGTTSKKQKLTVSGNVTGVTITPITAPTAAPTVEPVTAQPATPAAAPPAGAQVATTAPPASPTGHVGQ